MHTRHQRAVRPKAHLGAVNTQRRTFVSTGKALKVAAGLPLCATAGNFPDDGGSPTPDARSIVSVNTPSRLRFPTTGVPVMKRAGDSSPSASDASSASDSACTGDADEVVVEPMVIPRKRMTIKREASDAAAWFFTSNRHEALQTPSPWFFQTPAAVDGPAAGSLTRQRSFDGPRKFEPSTVQLLDGVGSPTVGTDVAGKVVKFTNCRLIRGHSLVRDDLWIRDGVIIDPVGAAGAPSCRSGVRWTRKSTAVTRL